MENSSDDNSPEKNQKKKNKYVTINNAHVKIDLESKRNSMSNSGNIDDKKVHELNENTDIEHKRDDNSLKGDSEQKEEEKDDDFLSIDVKKKEIEKNI